MTEQEKQGLQAHLEALQATYETIESKAIADFEKKQEETRRVPAT